MGIEGKHVHDFEWIHGSLWIHGHDKRRASSLLNDVTTSGKTKTLYETKFAMWERSSKSTFPLSQLLIIFFRGNLQEAMIRRLTVNDSEQAVWQKTEDYFASLLHNDTILTLRKLGRSYRDYAR